MSTNNRRGFDFARGNLWSIDPLEIRIIGGKNLPPEERGPLDTDDGPEHDLWDERLNEALTEEFINNIDAHGVDTPVLIVRIDEVATTLAGRKRIRAARVVNIRRKKRGEPPIKVDAKLKRVTAKHAGASLLGAMIRENEARTDDNVLTKIEKLKRLMDRGVSVEDAAIEFNVKLATVKGWLAFEDNATTETKAAARSGRLSASAAAEVAKITDADKQRDKLEVMLSSGSKVSARTARTASRIARGKSVGVSDKPTLKKLLDVIQSTSLPKVTVKEASFWEGTEELLKLVLGDKDADARLRGKLDEALALLKNEKLARSKK